MFVWTECELSFIDGVRILLRSLCSSCGSLIIFHEGNTDLSSGGSVGGGGAIMSLDMCVLLMVGSS